MADPARRPRDRAPRFQFDMSLLAALVDRWRPETDTFHLPVGEMTPTLQDVAKLLGLLCAGRAVGVEDVGLSCECRSVEHCGAVRDTVLKELQLLT